MCRVMLMIRSSVLLLAFAFAWLPIRSMATEEKNMEDLLIMRDKGLARLYMEKWERYRAQSEQF